MDLTSIMISRDLIIFLSAKYTKVFTVDNKRESLAEYVRRVREERKLSLTDVERQSGTNITNGYVSQIENGYIKNVSPEKLHALAKGLGVSEEEVFAVARGRSQSDGLTLDEMRLLEYYRNLKPDTQADVLAMIEGIYKRRINERTSKELSTKDGKLPRGKEREVEIELTDPKLSKVKPVGQPPRQRIPVIKPKDWAPEVRKKQNKMKVEDE